MAYINKKMVEAALNQAKAKLEKHKDGPLSEAYIEAKASVDCFEYVLRICGDVNQNTKNFQPDNPTEFEKALDQADQENYYYTVSLNPYLESLVKYVAENYKVNTTLVLWYRRLPGDNESLLTDKLYTHKEVVENWVEERGEDVISKQAKP